MKDNITTADLQAKTLEILKAFHEFCENNDLKYCMIGGTLLGAVRHNGFIPWDDDIDIGMPRDDYERLLAISKNFPSPYEIAHTSTDESFVYPFIKCYDTTTTLTEASKIPFTRGVWIDIFPFDKTYTNRPFRLVHAFVIRALKSLLTYKTGSYIPTETAFSEKLRETLIRAIAKNTNKTRLLRALDRTLKHKGSAEEYLTGNFLGRWGKREIVAAHILSSRTTLNFEGHQFYAPLNHDSYLKSVYGDYMTLPPESKRLPAHPALKVNLDQPYKEIAE